jgi:1-acyl-sn-glycerol-3-phosphate acyltransferase
MVRAEIQSRLAGDRMPIRATTPDIAVAKERLRGCLRTARAMLYAIRWWSVLALLVGPWLAAGAVLPSKWRWAAGRALARTFLRLTSIPLVVDRRMAIRAGIIVSNQSSNGDWLPLALALPGELSFVAKQELARMPFVRMTLRATETLFINRDDPKRAAEDIRHIADVARSGRPVVFFPEGRLTCPPGVGDFQLGAFAVAVWTGLPIIPVAICGTGAILPAGRWFPRRGRITVRVGDPIEPGGSHLADALPLRDAAHATVLAMWTGSYQPSTERRLTDFIADPMPTRH